MNPNDAMTRTTPINNSQIFVFPVLHTFSKLAHVHIVEFELAFGLSFGHAELCFGNPKV